MIPFSFLILKFIFLNIYSLNKSNNIGKMFQTKGRKGGRGLGIGGSCKCPKCDHRETHITGKPCMFKRCPHCGSLMYRV